MPLNVNQNLPALGILGNLERTSMMFNHEVERLSSGLRINRAADDPAGLLISEKYRAQADGLAQAIRNARDGISLAQTAEGALDEINSQLRVMRSLALHAASTGINDSASIAADQQQISAAIATIDRIANTTQFGARKLLDGSSGVSATVTNSNLTFLQGSTATQSGTYAVSVSQAAVQGVLRSASVMTFSQEIATAATGAGTTAAGDTLTFSGALINSGTAYTITFAAGVDATSVFNTISSDAVLNSSGMTAVLTAGKITLNSAKLGGAGTTEISVQANGASIETISGFSTTATGAVTAAASNTNQLRNTETLTFSDGALATVQVALTAGTTLAAAVSQVQSALVNAGIRVTFAFSSNTFSVTNTDAGSSTNILNTFQSSLAAAGAGAGINTNIANNAGTAVNIANGAGQVTSFTTGQDVVGAIGGFFVAGKGQTLTGPAATTVDGLQLKVAAGVSGSLGNVTVNQNSMVVQVGAFANQTGALNISDIRSNRLGVGTTGTTFQAIVDVAHMDVSTGNGKGAQDAILILDTAINQVGVLRSSLGSFQKDTLEAQVRNLMTAEQNMRAAESQIRDANVAVEALMFSRAQILQQTGIAMLASANTAPGALLALFR